MGAFPRAAVRIPYVGHGLQLAGQQLPPYLQNRLQVQDRYLDEIKKTFGSRLVGSVPELERDVTGLPMIERVAHLLYG